LSILNKKHLSPVALVVSPDTVRHSLIYCLLDGTHSDPQLKKSTLTVIGYC